MSRYINADPVAVDYGSKQIYANHGDFEATTGQLRNFQKGQLPGSWDGRAAVAQQGSFDGWDGVTKGSMERLRIHGENLGTAGRTLDVGELNVQQLVGGSGSGDSTVYDALTRPAAHA